MKYITREPGKDGGPEFDNAYAAIDHCVAWEIATGIQCRIISRHEYSGNEFPADYLTAVARCTAARANLGGNSAV